MQHNYVEFKDVIASDFRLENSTIGSQLCYQWQQNGGRDVKGTCTFGMPSWCDIS